MDSTGTLTAENFRFAKQAGATHIVAHWVDYFKGGIPETDGAPNWGISDNRGRLWTYEELSGLKKAISAERLELAAIENLDPSHWYDILLDGPQKAATGGCQKYHPDPSARGQ